LVKRGKNQENDSLKKSCENLKKKAFIGFITNAMLSPSDEVQKQCLYTHVLYDSLDINIIDHFLKLFDTNFLKFCEEDKDTYMEFLRADTDLNNLVNFIQLGCFSNLLKITDLQLIALDNLIKNIGETGLSKIKFIKILQDCIKFLNEKNSKNKYMFSVEQKTAPHNIIDINPKFVALQITFAMKENFSNLHIHDCLSKSIFKNENIKKITKYFERISYLVPTEILNKNGTEEQIDCTKYFISVAEELKILNNLNGLMAIIAGLNNKSIYRLEYLWDGKHKYDFIELNKFMDMTNNFGFYRNYTKQISGPIIPYIGLILSDIMHVMEMSIFDGVTSLNGHLIQTIYNILLKITDNQLKSINIINNMSISEYIANYNFLDNDELWDKSIEFTNNNNIISFYGTKKRSNSWSLSNSCDDDLKKMRKKLQNKNFDTSKENIKTLFENKTVGTDGHKMQKSEKKNVPILDMSEITNRTNRTNDNISKSGSSIRRNYYPPDLSEWTICDVSMWLISIKLGEYKNNFERNAITGEELVCITKEQMENYLGMNKLGHRIKLEKEIKKLEKDFKT
jgi:hypothetical protein